jgi:hypothetical protein
MFGILKYFKKLRVSEEDELMGLDAEHDEPAYPATAWVEGKRPEHSIAAMAIGLKKASSPNGSNNLSGPLANVAQQQINELQPERPRRKSSVRSILEGVNVFRRKGSRSKSYNMEDHLSVPDPVVKIETQDLEVIELGPSKSTSAVPSTSSTCAVILNSETRAI